MSLSINRQIYFGISATCVWACVHSRSSHAGTIRVRLLGLHLNSLDWRKGENGRALIHEWQSFRKKSNGSYLMTPDKTYHTLLEQWYHSLCLRFWARLGYTIHTSIFISVHNIPTSIVAKLNCIKIVEKPNMKIQQKKDSNLNPNFNCQTQILRAPVLSYSIALKLAPCFWFSTYLT